MENGKNPDETTIWILSQIIIRNLDKYKDYNPWIAPAPGRSIAPTQAIGGFKVSDAITKQNSARGAKTMEFPIGKFEGGANTIVKTIDSRWRRKP